jgi:hypothetical protein
VRHPGTTAARLAPLAPLLFLICACQPTPAATGPAGTPTSPAATASPSARTPATPAATATAETGIPAMEVSVSRDELAPGRYTHRGFVPRITFELAGPWHSVNALNGFFDVQQDVATPDVIAVQFARPVAPDDARAAASALQHNPRLTIVESSSSKIGRLTGYQVTVENPAGSRGDAQVLSVPPGPLLISPGRRLWIAFFDTPDGLLAIMVGGSMAKWDAALAAAEPVLESVTIGE